MGIGLVISFIEKNDPDFLGSLNADTQTIAELFREIMDLKDSIAECVEKASISPEEVNMLCERIAVLSVKLSDLTKHIGIRIFIKTFFLSFFFFLIIIFLFLYIFIFAFFFFFFFFVLYRYNKLVK